MINFGRPDPVAVSDDVLFTTMTSIKMEPSYMDISSREHTKSVQEKVQYTKRSNSNPNLQVEPGDGLPPPSNSRSILAVGDVIGSATYTITAVSYRNLKILQ